MDIKQIVLDLCAMNDEQEWFGFKENWFQPETLGEGNEPMISVFSDRIEILSRGALPPAQTMEGFYLGNRDSAQSRLFSQIRCWKIL